MTTDNASQIPYQACLMTIFPEEIRHQVRDITNHVVIPLNMLVAVMSFVCNALVVYTVARTKSLQRPPLLMLCSLAITDLIYAPVSIFMFMEVLIHEHMCPDSSNGQVEIWAPLCILATLGNLAITSRDRYLAVKRPWWYRTHMTKTRVRKMMCVPWFFSAVLAFLVYLARDTAGSFPPVAGRVGSLIFYFICFLVITFNYLGLLCGKTEPEEAPNIRVTLEREKRMANTVGLILLVLLATLLPGALIPMVLSAIGVPNVRLYKPFFGLLSLLNGFLNPLLNFGRSKDMRRALAKLLKCSQIVRPLPKASTSKQPQQKQQQQQQQDYQQ